MKSYYVIDFLAKDCFIDIRVNDVPIISMNVVGQISTIYPVNTAILESGKQQVSYKILPILGEFNLRDSVDFLASVCLFDASGERIKKVNEIDKYKLEKDNTGIPIPLYTYSKLFNAEVQYKLNSWQNSINLNDIDNLRELVDKAYKKIERIVSSKQINFFEELLKEKENNSCMCMYLSEELKNQRMIGLTKKLSGGFQVIPSTPQDIMFIYGFGKLVGLRTPSGDSALRLYNSETKQGMSLDVLFHLKKDKQELSII